MGWLRAPESAPPRRAASNARATRSRIPVRDLALAQQRQLVVAAAASRIVTRFVSVPKPDPGSLTSFATSRSTPLRAELVRAPDRAIRSPPRTRRGRASRGRRAVASVPCATRDLGEDVRGRLELEREAVAARRSSVGRGRRRLKSATAAAITRASTRRRPGSRQPMERAELRRRLDAHHRRGLGQRRPRRSAAIKVTLRAARERGLRDRDAHPAGRAVADVAHGIDRLRACRRR